MWNLLRFNFEMIFNHINFDAIQFLYYLRSIIIDFILYFKAPNINSK